MNAKRGLSSDRAREVRQAGHADAATFALSIGMDKDYQNDKQAKKDVIDPSGDAHSVKSGSKKWQIFLYGRNRFINDDGFQALNGIGGLLIHCIDSFPPSFSDYNKDKNISKERLKTPMRELKDRFQRKALLRSFLNKSIFNGGEVDYLTILDDDKYHVFYCKDVVSCLGNNFTIENSQVRAKGQHSEQKVLFKYNNLNVGELEMRNDSVEHYQEVRFNMLKRRTMEMLYLFSKESKKYSDNIIVYDTAIKRFGNWKN
jgi:hypothetical protein